MIIKFNQPSDYHYNGKTVCINPNYVISIHQVERESYSKVLTMEGTIAIEGSPEDIAKKLNGDENE